MDIEHIDKEFSNEYFSLVHSASGWVAIARDHEGRGATAHEALGELWQKISKKNTTHT